jgi:hypothetical protein
LIITHAVKEDDTTWSFDLALSNEEVAILVDFSIQAMLQQGEILLNEQEEEQDIPLPGATFASSSTSQ